MQEYVDIYIRSGLSGSSQIVLSVLMLFAVFCCFAYRKHLAYFIFPIVFLFFSCLSLYRVEETYKELPNMVLIAVDDSVSQSIKERIAQTETALSQLKKNIKETSENTKIVTVRITKDFNKNLETALDNLPQNRLSALIIITDGQIDLKEEELDTSFPVHVLLTGKPKEGDRQLLVLKEPEFGFVGSEATATLVVNDIKNDRKTDSTKTAVSIRYSDNRLINVPVETGKPFNVFLPIETGGKNRFTIETEVGKEEISLANNIRILNVSGIHKSLKILHISGKNHLSSRFWKDFFSSDPLVEIDSYTPYSNDEKIQELQKAIFGKYNLVVIDHYKKDLLCSKRLEKLAEYVKEGGSLLVVAGENFHTGINDTVLRTVLPVTAAKKKEIKEHFRPKISEEGLKNPITSGLREQAENWGRWLKQIPVIQKSGKTLLTGYDEFPLLVTDETEKGRIAVLLSDSIWLWQKGFEQGGPYKKLLGNISGWLLKDNDMETARPIESSFKDKGFDISDKMFKPENFHEVMNLVSTKKNLKSLVKKTKGSFLWLSELPFESGSPDVRQIDKKDKTYGMGEASKQWIGLIKRDTKIIFKLEQDLLIPAWSIFVFTLLWLIVLWKKEGESD